MRCRRPVGRKPVGRFVYVANQGTEAKANDTVSVIDVASSKVVKTIHTGAGAHGVTVNNGGAFVFVTNIVDGTVSLSPEVLCGRQGAERDHVPIRRSDPGQCRLKGLTIGICRRSIQKSHKIDYGTNRPSVGLGIAGVSVALRHGKGADWSKNA
ncbi:hypothetical protein [Mesorhizobium sp.]|uniref:YncE family protein n=1 Tax=Mesorhizobium sp. TaxID=1871066 RepID=UPI0025EF1834|nr:hypothetical protein [Mesorhizobium sp.]